MTKIKCYKCDKEINGDGNTWYHGDQDDVICNECAYKTEHTDTACAGLPVLQNMGGLPF